MRGWPGNHDDTAPSLYTDVQLTAKSAALAVGYGSILWPLSLEFNAYRGRNLPSHAITHDCWQSRGEFLSCCIHKIYSSLLGIDQVQYRAEYVIEDGKIRFFYPRVILTPEQQAMVRAAQ
jgi:hypothetical protein